MSEHLGLVTVLYNCEGVLQDFFDTLAIQTYKDFELIIVDNFSKDKSLDTCKKLALSAPFKCYFIENEVNLGVAAGNNQGIKIAFEHNCEKILLTNNDIVLREDTIQELYDSHIANNADLSVPKIYYAGTNKIWCAGGKFNKLKGTTTHFGYCKEDAEKFNELKQVEYAPTCFMLINKEVFNNVGLMDEKFFVYYDDTDFVYRSVIKKSFSLWYIPNSIVQHKVSFSTGSESDFNIRYMLRNRIYFAKKHNTFPHLFYIINLFYHKTVRRIKLMNNKHKYEIISSALEEGWLL